MKKKRETKADELHKNKLSRLTSSEGRKQILGYLREISDDHKFQGFVIEMRKKYGIRKSGFTYNEKRYPYPPKRWKHYNDSTKRVAISNAAKEKSRELGLPPIEASEIIEGYIFYTCIELPYTHNAHHLCIVSDLLEEKQHPYTEEIQSDDNYFYPIAIRISPQAGLRTILDYITKAYKPEIKELQQKYKDPDVRIGGKKGRKDIRERNNFIYDLHVKGFKIKEIVTAVTDNYGETLDEGHVGKIISNERKKRKKM